VIDDASIFRTKERVLFDLSRALGFSAVSLEANQQGRLTSEQVKQLSGRVLRPLFGAVLCAVTPMLFWTVLVSLHEHVRFQQGLGMLVVQLMHPAQLLETYGRMGMVFRLGSVLIGVGLAVFGASKVPWALYLDLLDRRVIIVEGRVVAREEQIMKPNGRDPIENYYFSVKGDYHPVSLAAYRAIENGSVYVAYVTPRSRTLVSMEPKMNDSDSREAPAPRTSTITAEESRV
jgi:hypothetical protein